jgi:hypothetical protein
VTMWSSFSLKNGLLHPFDPSMHHPSSWSSTQLHWFTLPEPFLTQ